MKKLFQIVWRLLKFSLFTLGVLVVLCWVAIIAFALLSPAEGKIADKSVLVFDLNAQITDRPVDESGQALAALFGGGSSALQLRAVTTALHEAATDARIVGLYLHGNLASDGYSSGFAALKEVREAVLAFRKSGKPVIAYATDADNRDYYLLSAADSILLNPFGVLAFRGLAGQGMFYKGAADKYGVEFTPIRHGKYKSAIEPFTRESFSAESREQMDALLKSVWSEVLYAVADTRKITPDALQALVNQEGLIQPELAKAKGLVTELAYEGQALDKLRTLTGRTAKDKTFPQVDLAHYTAEARKLAAAKQTGKDKIAVVYAEGGIVDGQGEAMDSGVVAGDRFARMLRKLRQRDDVKAIVLRVNSPGGSATASEVILEELRRLKETRPVIVSMGTVAASGGYWISTASTRIFAQPSTITGSIGVFGLGMNAQRLANDHGITFDTVKTADLADFGTVTRPMTATEQKVMQGLVDHIYDEFITRVGASRNLATNRVDEIAQGRVWSGADALKMGLVDELGGLEQAIAAAAKAAKLGTSYSVLEYPPKKALMVTLSEAFSGEKRPLAAAGFVGQVSARVAGELRFLTQFNDPRGVYVRLPADLLVK